MACVSVARKVGNVIRSGGRILLLLDFDGTISRIVENPGDAHVVPEAAVLLEKLSSSLFITCGVISGRELSDVKSRVPVGLPVWAGNHGAQVEIMGTLFALGDVGERRELERIFREISTVMTTVEGVVVEDKGESISVHTRKLSGEKEHLVQEKVRRLVESTPGVELRVGKRVVEIFPDRAPDKGEAFSFILRKVEEIEGGVYFPVYFGDDVTDISVYDEMKRTGNGIFVFVRDRELIDFEAEYEVDGVDGVISCLEELSRIAE